MIAARLSVSDAMLRLAPVDCELRIADLYLAIELEGHLALVGALRS